MSLRTACGVAVSVLALAAPATAQSTVVHFADNLTNTGTSNTHPFNVNTTGVGFTSIMFYPGAVGTPSLAAAGVTSSMKLVDLAIVPITAGSNTYNNNQARILIGNCAFAPTVGGASQTAWESHLTNPTVLWDTAVDGPLTFPWTGDTWVSLPISPNAQFNWDGVSDVGVMITLGGSAGAASGAFSVRTANPQIYIRHGCPGFNPPTGTTQQTTGVLGMRMRMSFDFGFNLAANSSGGGVGDLGLALSNIPPGTVEGFCFVTADTTGALGAGPFLGLWPDLTTWSIITVPAGPGNPLHWLTGFPGLFPDTPFILPAGTLSFLGGTSWRFVGAAFGPGLQYLSRSNVVQVNW
ncbi:MAG TPA: hypothetical protein VEI02_13900 [Planctomycetota bacterium]|nr:hypothetical protein [Planctomycetota bacterium]